MAIHEKPSCRDRHPASKPATARDAPWPSWTAVAVALARCHSCPSDARRPNGLRRAAIATRRPCTGRLGPPDGRIGATRRWIRVVVRGRPICSCAVAAHHYCAARCAADRVFISRLRALTARLDASRVGRSPAVSPSGALLLELVNAVLSGPRAAIRFAPLYRAGPRLHSARHAPHRAHVLRRVHFHIACGPRFDSSTTVP